MSGAAFIRGHKVIWDGSPIRATTLAFGTFRAYSTRAAVTGKTIPIFSLKTRPHF